MIPSPQYLISLFFVFLITIALISSWFVESNNHEVKTSEQAQHMSRPEKSKDVFWQSPNMPPPSNIVQAPLRPPEGVIPSLFIEPNPSPRNQGRAITASLDVSGTPDTTSGAISITTENRDLESITRIANSVIVEFPLDSPIGLVRTDDGLVPSFKEGWTKAKED